MLNDLGTYKYKEWVSKYPVMQESSYIEKTDPYQCGLSLQSLKILNLAFMQAGSANIKDVLPFPNYYHFLKGVIRNASSIEALMENLNIINRWCFLNVGANRYGFYSPIDKTIILRTQTSTTHGHGTYFSTLWCQTTIVFENPNDLLAFKLKFG